MSHRLYRGFPEPGAIAGDAVATIGVFDGVHLGHQQLLRRVASAARDGAAALITFDPHPRCVLAPSGCPASLTTVPERALLAARLGVPATIVLEFTAEFSRWSAASFCDRLVEAIDLRCLVVGPGFALGRDREGDERFLREYGAARGFDLEVMPPVERDGAPVSSGRVRSAIAGGRVDLAATLLGRFHRLAGRVEHGEGRGRSLGFPTANIAVEAGRCLPGDGVYATWLHAGDRWYPAATNVGVRPTFGSGGAMTVEAFVLDADLDLYGREVRLDFVERLREERAFPDPAALIAQMRDDVDTVRGIMRGRVEPDPVP